VVVVQSTSWLVRRVILATQKSVALPSAEREALSDVQHRRYAGVPCHRA